MRDPDWRRLIAQLDGGRCTPFLGAGASDGVLAGGPQISRRWAGSAGYPFDDADDLARVMQYVAVEQDDPVETKIEFAEREFRGAAPPDFADPAEPHAALARFPIPVYLTTNYDDFMTKALHSAGRSPMPALCPWYPHADASLMSFASPEEFRDTAYHRDHPVVYHLHGHHAVPRSMVLTEDDYLEFLIQIAQVDAEFSKHGHQLVPPLIREAIASQSLLFVGYSLRDWTFRVLFHGLLHDLGRPFRHRHVSVQLNPSGATAEQRGRAAAYLERYFDNLNVTVFWGTARGFFAELHRRTGLGGGS
jgi:SIR2-like protein